MADNLYVEADQEPESMSLRQLRKGIPLLWSEQGKMSEA
jgi:hypothetical protein